MFYIFVFFCLFQNIKKRIVTIMVMVNFDANWHQFEIKKFLSVSKTESI
jgi:hypothetical protein